ncbi:F-box only protein 5 isoform X1 [Lagopus leucura]|uniref:F-box only protein 5 isoform X1 n=2 Tax=Lagopus leucura TaxID=30410 RepID=UPI001C672E83|nr:F-box only protein 5 isoform X1 [Lagopus leucura]
MSTGRDTRLQKNSLEHYSDNRTAFQIMKAGFLMADKQYSYLLSKTPCCCCSVLKVNLTGPDVTAVFNFSTEKILIHHSQKNTNRAMKSNLNHSFKMKCDFNQTALHGGFTPVKSAEKTKPEEPCPLKSGEKLYRSCDEEHQKILSELYHAASRNLDPEDEGKPVHNKENKHVTQRFDEGVYEMEALENSKLNEDSGYSSMLSSQYSDATEQEDSLPLSGNLCSTPQHCLEKNEFQVQLSKKTLLPVSHYEEMICSTLKKSGKRNLKSWTDFDRIVFREHFELRNLIGKKMGLDRIDVLAELFQKNLKHILASILRHLGEMDLINFAKVSATWKKILQEDKWGFQMYSKALDNLSSGTKTSEHAATREYVLYRAALASVQKATPPNSLSKKGNRSKASKNYSRLMEFSEAAKTLKNTESFKVCNRCGSPAKYDSYLQRAMCNRESCGFDFCTKCMCSYHSSSDCMTGKPVKSSFKLGTLPGTKKSKQNLRRL